MDSNIVLQPDASMTTLAAAQANVLAGTTREVGLLNDNLKTQYLNGFNNWAENVLIGRVENTNPPQPPNAYTVEVGADGWAYPAQGTTPICPMPPIP
ncbi:MAG TPA: hypothetical protein VHC72_15955, partial [Bryobacteraceae bacterium]|nr:hypothetical protein [Bryobacteraceae bacterium]